MKKSWVIFIGSVCVISLLVLLVVRSRTQYLIVATCKAEPCTVIGEKIAKYLDIGSTPCENVYEFACGKWFEVSKSKEYSVFDRLEENLVSNLKDALSKSSLKGALPVQLASFLYQSCVNIAPYYASKYIEEELENFGTWPLIQSFDKTSNENYSDYNWVDSYITIRVNYMSNWLLGIYVTSHPRDSSKQIIKIDLPEMDQVWPQLNNDPKQASEEYKKTIYKWINLMRETQNEATEEMVDDIIQLEKELANLYFSYNHEFINYKYIKISSLDKIESNKTIPWKLIIQEIFSYVNITLAENEPILFINPEYYEKLEKIISKIPKRTLASYLGLKVVQKLGPLILDIPSEEKFKQDHCLNLTHHYYSHALKRMYLEKYFDNSMKQRVETIGQEIKKYFINNFKDLHFMDDATRKIFLEKLNALQFTIGYEDWIGNRALLEDYYKDYSDFVGKNFLVAIIDTLTGIVSRNLRSLRNQTLFALTEIDSPAVHKIEKYYSPQKNKLVYSVGLLQPPIYFSDAPLAINYGSIGSLIGQDMIHVFDNIGKMYDAQGFKKHWWSESSQICFNQKMSCFREKYNNLIGRNNLTLDDIISISKGMELSYNTIEQILANSRYIKVPKSLKDYSLQKIFFISYAQMWCSNDKHNQMQVNQILKNFKKFIDIYKCKKLQTNFNSCDL